MDETKPVQDIERRTHALAQEAAARGAEKVRQVDLTSGVRAVSHALHRAADTLGEEGYGSLASITHRAADGCSDFVSRTGDRDPQMMLREVQRFARDNPAFFIGGCALVGFALARFFSTSSEGHADVPAYSPVVEHAEVPIAPPVYHEPSLGVPPGGTR